MKGSIARLDQEHRVRTGVPEAVFAAGKTLEQNLALIGALYARTGFDAVRATDVGVAGIHRLFDMLDDILTSASSSSPGWKARCPASSPDSCARR